jgi:hypothetical protein
MVGLMKKYMRRCIVIFTGLFFCLEAMNVVDNGDECNFSEIEMREVQNQNIQRLQI